MAEENKSETVSGSIDTKLLINVYGSPATGKSFTAQNITTILHENGIDCEYIAEYATELIQQGRTDELKDQITVTGEQRRREVEAFKRTNLVITDSPTALGMLYSPKEQKAEVVKFGEQSDKTPHINILLRHNAESLATFSMNGRIHGKEESLRIQSEIVAMLQGKECLHFERGMSIEKLINDIRSTQQWQHFARSQSVEEKERTLRIAKCLQGEPVCVINDRLAPHGQGHSALRKWAKNEVFSHWNYKVISPELGEIVVDENSARDTFAHGLSPFKIEAVRAIKDVIEQGVVFTQTKIEDNDHYFIAAPVTIEDQVDIVSVLVRKDMNTQRMYLHSVMVREKILEKDFEQKNTPEHTFPKADSRGLSEQNRKLYSGDIGRILQNYLKVNIRELEVEINQQIEQKGNKMDEQQQQTSEKMDSKNPQQFVQDTIAQYPAPTILHNLDNGFGEPFVRIYFSENPLLHKNQILSIRAADKIFAKLDEMVEREKAADEYRTADKVDFAVISQNRQFNGVGQERYDLGDSNGGLFGLLSENPKYHDLALHMTNYLTADERLGLLDRTDKQMEVDNNYAMAYPEVKEARMAMIANRGVFFERLQQQILQQDKTVEQHLSEMVDEVVAIANRHNQEQSQVESVSGNLKDEVKAIHQELAAQSLEFQFTHKGLADRTAAFNQELLQLAPEQLKELQPFFEQHKAIQTLQGLYEQTNDTARLEEINEHNRLLEWKIHNKVEAYLGKHIDYSDMNYYKNIKTGEELQQMMNEKQPENEVSALSQSVSSSPEPETAPQSQPQVDEPKNFVQKFEDAHQNNSDKNQADLTTLGSISDPEIFQKMIMFNPVPENETNQMIDEIIKERTYLAVDMEHKDIARVAGAKWDKVLKGWYAEKGNLNEELQQFLPQQPEITIQNRKQLSDFVAYARTIGVEISDLKENATGWVRCPVSGKSKNNRDGGYRLFRNDDGSIGATAKNYCTGDTVNWCDKVIGEKQVKSKVPLPDFIANKKQNEWNEIAKTTVDFKIEQQRAATAAAVYHQLPAALPTDPYIQRKGIVDIGKLRRLDDGSTIVPLYNNGRIANLQMIRTSDNEKRMMTQATKQGAYYSIGNSRNPKVVLIAEGIATADSVHQIAIEIYGKDNVLTLSAIDSGNLKNVAEKVDKVYPDAQKIVAADNDAKNALEARLKYKNAGLEKAQQVAQEVQDFQVALCPALNDEKGEVKNTDWNDYLSKHGKEKAKQAFCRSLNGLQQTSVKSVEHKRNGTDGREL